jgi:CubicO group peptidase (beta-lactamase class C family)
VTDLRGVLQRYVDDGTYPGAVGLIAQGDRVEVAAVGHRAVGGAAMTEDSIFRLASITKPITAAAVMMLVDDGLLRLDDPVARWLPELDRPMVVRTPSAPTDDVVPARRAITVFDLLSAQAGYGFASDFGLPSIQALATVQGDGRHPRAFPPPAEWTARLGALPLAFQPGESWLYDTCSTLQGVLVERVTGGTLPAFLASRLFQPLGMTDAGFWVSATDRMTSYYGPDRTLVDGPDGEWSSPPAFALGNAGLAGTAHDWLAFGRLLLGDGVTAGGQRLLTTDSVRRMTTDHTTPAHREIGALFLEGQGWGFGGSVDIERIDPWNVPGRYGWVGGTGTTAHIDPSSGKVAILLTQVAAESPVVPSWMRDFWLYAAAHER